MRHAGSWAYRARSGNDHDRQLLDNARPFGLGLTWTAIRSEWRGVASLAGLPARRHSEFGSTDQLLRIGRV